MKQSHISSEKVFYFTNSEIYKIILVKKIY